MSGAALLAQEERLELLLREIKWAEEKAALYRTAFARAGVSHASVTRFSDMARLPFLEYSEEEGADAPFFMLTLPLSGILRLSVLRDTDQCSGRIHCYTQGDVARQVRTAADMLAACGVNRASTALLTGDFDDSRVLDLQYALETIGATVLPCESANRTCCGPQCQIPSSHGNMICPRLRTLWAIFAQTASLRSALVSLQVILQKKWQREWADGTHISLRWRKWEH